MLPVSPDWSRMLQAVRSTPRVCAARLYFGCVIAPVIKSMLGNKKTGIAGRILSEYWWWSRPRIETCARTQLQSRSEGRTDRRDCADVLRIPAAPLGAKHLEPDDAARCAHQPPRRLGVRNSGHAWRSSRR
jgi:hypothetical protein